MIRRCSPSALATALALAAAGCTSTAPPLAQAPPPEVTISRPVVREITEYDEYPGKVRALQTVEIRARVDGYLTQINFQDGAAVNEGDLLFQIDPRPYQADYDSAKAQADNAKAQLKLAEIERIRYENLLRRNTASREDVDRAITTRNQALATLDLAASNVERAKLNLDWTDVYAPIDGRLGRRNIDIGNLINGAAGAATPLTSLVAEDPIYVDFDVDERSIQRYRRQAAEGHSPVTDVTKIAAAKIPVHVGLSGDEGFPHVGIIDFVDNQVNATTGTVRCRGLLPNPSRTLQSGYFARVRVRSGEPRRAVQVAERAVGTLQGERYVLVVERGDAEPEGDGAAPATTGEAAPAKVEYRKVGLGRIVDGLRVVESGLEGDEWVVVDGLQRAQPGERVTPDVRPMPAPREEMPPAPAATTASAAAPAAAPR